MSNCYKYKDVSDIDRNFDKNLSIQLEMPRYHTEVFYDLGREIADSRSFNLA
jgi:hypothetical protein